MLQNFVALLVQHARLAAVDRRHISRPSFEVGGGAGTPRAGTVQIFNTPLHQERRVMSRALYAQDAYTVKRLTLTGGIRWERVEGYLCSG